MTLVKEVTKTNQKSTSLSGLTNRALFRIELQEPYEEVILRDEKTPNIRSVIFSPKGTYLAYRTDRK